MLFLLQIYNKAFDILLHGIFLIKTPDSTEIIISVWYIHKKTCDKSSHDFLQSLLYRQTAVNANKNFLIKSVLLIETQHSGYNFHKKLPQKTETPSPVRKESVCLGHENRGRKIKREYKTATAGKVPEYKRALR